MSFITPQDEFENLQFGAMVVWAWSDLGANKKYDEWCFMLIQTNSLNYMAIPFYHYSKTAAGLSNAYDSAIFLQYMQKQNHFNGYRLVLDDSDGTGLTDQEIIDTILGNNIILPIEVDINQPDLAVEKLTFGSTLYEDFKAVDIYCNRVSKTNLRSQIRTMVGRDVLNRYRYEQVAGFEDEFIQQQMDVREGYYMSFFSTLSILLPQQFAIDQALSLDVWQKLPEVSMVAVILSERFNQDNQTQVYTEAAQALGSVVPGVDLLGGGTAVERSFSRWWYPLKGNVLYEQATQVKEETSGLFSKAKTYLRNTYFKTLYKMGQGTSSTKRGSTGGLVYQTAKVLFKKSKIGKLWERLT